MIDELKKQFISQSAKLTILSFWAIASLLYFLFEERLVNFIGQESDLILLRATLLFLILSVGLGIYLFLNRQILKFDSDNAIYFDKHQVPHCPSCFSQEKRIAPMKTRESDWLCLNKSCQKLYHFPGEIPKKRKQPRRIRSTGVNNDWRNL
ncbi:MAG: hypothetical protein ACI8XV_001634 [Arenicella sp.]|jgi:hypothetical protein